MRNSYVHVCTYAEIHTLSIDIVLLVHMYTVCTHQLNRMLQPKVYSCMQFNDLAIGKIKLISTVNANNIQSWGRYFEK